MNILSLFDGISCGRVALERSGIIIDNYYASEIDKTAIKISKQNHDDIQYLGNIKNWQTWTLPKIDLILAGSPCTDLSVAGKQQGIMTDTIENYNKLKSENYQFKGQSYLFWEFINIFNHYKPKYFLLENVIMKSDIQDIISRCLGVEPIEINSALVSAQNRRRLYWTNIDVKQPQDKNINLKDILESDAELNPSAIRGRYINKATIVGRRLNSDGHREDYNKKIPITQCLEVRKTNRNKSNCLTTVDKDNVLTSLPVGRHVDVFNKNLPFRYYTVKECCRLQTLDDNYCDNISKSQAKKAIGNGWTIDVISHILKNIINQKVIYIAGPMRGYDNYNFPQFFKVAEVFKTHGYKVFNPAEMDIDNGINPKEFDNNFNWNIEPSGTLLTDFVKRDILVLCECTHIFMLKNWENSIGAKAELAVAKWLKLKIIYQKE